ncbi:hypothetical protein T09_314 [Trichinella sp. T9]|nr:hypothetical protein T09_314 [Trichinella sp. T9]
MMDIQRKDLFFEPVKHENIMRRNPNRYKKLIIIKSSDVEKLVGKHGSVLWAIQTITDTLIIIENFTFTKNFKKMIFCAANARNLRSTIHFIRILIENKLNIQRLADNMAKRVYCKQRVQDTIQRTVMLRSSRTGRARRMTISIHHTPCYSTLTTSFLPPVDLQKGIVDMFEKLEENILLYHMKNLLTLTRLQNILHFPPPVQFGKIKNGFATKIYSSLHYPFDVAKRIIGPNNLTAKAIQNICECRIQLLHEKNNTIKVMVFAENDYDSILMFKLWKTLQCINCLLEIHPFGKDFVGEIQQADSQFWERQMEIIFNSLPIISSLPVSQYDSTFTVSSENLKRTC